MLEEEGLEGSGAVLKKGDRETNSGCKLRNWFLNLCFCDHAVACSRLMLFQPCHAISDILVLCSCFDEPFYA